MPVHVGEFNSEMTVVDGELPLTAAQVDKLVKLVCQRLEKDKRAGGQAQEATELRAGVAPKLDMG